MHFSFRRESGILCLDLLIALFAFWLARYFGTLPRWYWLVLSAVVWVILGGVSRKLQFDSYKRIRYALLGVFTLNVFSGLSIYFLYRHFVPGYEADHSILVATGIITLLEWSLYGLLRTFVYRKIPYFYEEPLLEDVTEAGVRSENEMAEKIRIQDIDMLLSLTREKKGEQGVVAWLKEHPHLFASDTILLDSSNPEAILVHKTRTPALIVHVCSLNKIRHLNTFFPILTIASMPGEALLVIAPLPAFAERKSCGRRLRSSITSSMCLIIAGIGYFLKCPSPEGSIIG